MAGFVKILLRANFNQANLKTDIISQIYSDNKLLLNDVPDNKEPTQEPKNRKVNVHLQTNVASATLCTGAGAASAGHPAWWY